MYGSVLQDANEPLCPADANLHGQRSEGSLDLWTSCLAGGILVAVYANLGLMANLQVGEEKNWELWE